jgi:translocation and assembly module TamB
MEDLTITRQRDQTVRGRVFLSSLDVGTIAGGVPGVAFTGARPTGKVSARIDLERLRPDHLEETKATADLYDLAISRGGRKVELSDTSGPIVVGGGGIQVPRIELLLTDSSGLNIGFSARGAIEDFAGTPKVAASLEVAPFELSRLKRDVAGIERIAGTLGGGLEITGPLAAPTVTGSARLRRGALALTDVPLALEDVELDVAVSDGEIRVTRATAKAGAGTIDVTGRVPIVGLGLGTAVATITARGVKLPVQDGVDLVADADLDATIRPGPRSASNLPEIHGTLRIVSFAYSRPIALSIDIGELSKRLGKTEVTSYDPADDLLRFDVMVVSPRPLAVRNDLADVRLEIVDPGIRLSGTNQRYGAEGQLKLLPDSKIRLRNHEFEVREGFVRFDDPDRVRADIDVRAVTEFRRYASAQDAEGAPDAGAAGSGTTAGQWEIDVHAHGSTDKLKLDLSSDPPLDQEDIVLLLGVGMTRAEIDRGLASSLGETVGLEALSALTGADKAVRSVVPIIDYFHFGSSYSSRTGRTEPNVTVGKRLTDDLRASVTTTLTERDVAATLEWRLKKGVSVQASYDNSNDIGSIIGNLGADLRWRLEFE